MIPAKHFVAMFALSALVAGAAATGGTSSPVDLDKLNEQCKEFKGVECRACCAQRKFEHRFSEDGSCTCTVHSDESFDWFIDEYITQQMEAKTDSDDEHEANSGQEKFVDSDDERDAKRLSEICKESKGDECEACCASESFDHRVAEDGSCVCTRYNAKRISWYKKFIASRVDDESEEGEVKGEAEMLSEQCKELRSVHCKACCAENSYMHKFDDDGSCVCTFYDESLFDWYIDEYISEGLDQKLAPDGTDKDAARLSEYCKDSKDDQCKGCCAEFEYEHEISGDSTCKCTKFNPDMADWWLNTYVGEHSLDDNATKLPLDDEE